jgi:hypothetical protein
MQETNRSWPKWLREIRQIDSYYGARLLVAKNPAEATTICNWIKKYVEIVATEQCSFTIA